MSVREVDVDEAIRLRDAGSIVVDVREPFEWDAGHVAGALHIPLAELPGRLATDLPDRSAPILLYCRSGARSGRAAQFLVANGYADVVNLNAPDRRLARARRRLGGAGEGAHAPQQARRYARQLRLPEIGPEGQQRLADAKVLIVGAGGLGSPAAIYLAAAGVGLIGLVDDDVVEESNLHRQPLHSTERIGLPKVDSASMALHGINPETTVLRHAGRLTPDNADRLVAGHDVVIDGTDRLDARYAINDAAVRQRVPLVHGSVYRWEGQVTTIVPFSGPCYRCLHPDQPPEELAPDCDVAGVVGVVPGLVGMLQATEALKLILGAGEPLVGRLLLVDALGTRFEELTALRDPACAACGAPAATRVAPCLDALRRPAFACRRSSPRSCSSTRAGSCPTSRARCSAVIRSAVSVTSVHPARNRLASPYRYDVEPLDLVRIVHQLEEGGDALVAIFHSHPRSPAVPSGTDVREARYPVVHLVASLGDAEPVLRAWTIEAATAREVPLTIAP